MSLLCITNNFVFYDKHKAEYDIYYYDVSLRDIFVKTRDKIHENYKLIIHPLYGSIKPNETPFRTIFLEKWGKLDFKSVQMIESAINACDKFIPIDLTKYTDTDRALDDFLNVDLYFCKTILEGIKTR